MGAALPAHAVFSFQAGEIIGRSCERAETKTNAGRDVADMRHVFAQVLWAPTRQPLETPDRRKLTARSGGSDWLDKAQRCNP